MTQPPTARKKPGRELAVTAVAAMTPESVAAIATDGSLTSTTITAYVGAGPELDIVELLGVMRKAGDEVAAGDFGRVERLLTHQLLALDAMFNNLAQRAARQQAYKGIEVLTRLALKSQAQARATAEALSAMKYPATFIRQANIAQGPQQINNSMPVPAEKIESAPSKLLEEPCHGPRLDTGAPQAASRAHPHLAAVGS